MARCVCCVCGQALGMFTAKEVLRDGVLCGKCLKDGGLRSLSSGKTLSADYVAKIIKEKMNTVKSFQPTKTSGMIKIDTINKAFKIEGEIFLFSNLVSYRFHEDPNNSQTPPRDGKNSGAVIGGIVGGLSGGLMGGTIGAAVGGKIGSLFSSYCNHMGIRISLRDSLRSDLRLTFISEKTRVGSDEYSSAIRRANECLDALQYIAAQNEEMKAVRPIESKNTDTQKIFVQDKHMTALQIEQELRVYKNMQYTGMITEEEFEQKKKQLLSMM